MVAEILPALRGALSSNRRVIAHYSDHEDALAFAGSKWSRELSALGTSCPDHFLRTKVCPLFVDWDPAKQDIGALKAGIQAQVAEYRAAYKKYYADWATNDSPKLRDSNPSVVIVPGLGLFGFGKNKKEARITTEFFINAIHVMAGANALEDGDISHPLPQARRGEQSQQFTHFHNYVALPRSEAFRIEYWALEEAKLQRMPAEAEFSRKIGLIIGGASGIGREVALLLARRGAHLVIADFDEAGAKSVAEQAGSLASAEFVKATSVDLSSTESLERAVRDTILEFGGIDMVVNTAAIYPVAGTEGRVDGSAVGADIFGECYWQLFIGARDGACVQRAGVGGNDGAYEFGERGRAKKRKRGLRHQQGGAESLDPGAGHQACTNRTSERNRSGYGRRRVRDVSTRQSDPVVAKIWNHIFGIGIDRGTARQACGILCATDAYQATHHTGTLRGSDCVASW